MLFLFIAEIMPQMGVVMNHNWSFRHANACHLMPRVSVEMNRTRLKCFAHVVCRRLEMRALQSNDMQRIHKKVFRKTKSLEEHLGVLWSEALAAIASRPS